MLYQHSAALFDVRYAQKDYAAEASRFTRLAARIHPAASTLLDVACGSGLHLKHLRSAYRVEGLDLSPELLQTARSRLGDVPLHHGDMSRFDLKRSYDLVTSFFASIAYLPDVETMRQAIACMARHLATGGVLFLEPWLTPSVYRENEVVHNFRRTPERAISWMYVMRRRGSVAVWDIHWLVGTPEGGVTHFVENEELSLFTTDEVIGAMRDVGLDVVHDARGLHGYGAMIARAGSWSPQDVAAIHAALAD
jgi:SAM-dependent methyltransferase